MMLSCYSSSIRVDPVGLDVLFVRLQSLDPSLPILHRLGPEVPDAVRHGDVKSELVLKSRTTKKIDYVLKKLQPNCGPKARWFKRKSLKFVNGGRELQFN